MKNLDVTFVVESPQRTQILRESTSVVSHSAAEDSDF